MRFATGPAHDPDFLRLFIQCLHETERSRRVALPASLCGLAAKPFGYIWDDDHTAMHIQTGDDPSVDIAITTEAALD